MKPRYNSKAEAKTKSDNKPRPQVAQKSSTEKVQQPQASPERRPTPAPKQQVPIQQPATPKLPEQPKQSKWTPELVEGKQRMDQYYTQNYQLKIPFHLPLSHKQYFLDHSLCKACYER